MDNRVIPTQKCEGMQNRRQALVLKSIRHPKHLLGPPAAPDIYVRGPRALEPRHRLEQSSRKLQAGEKMHVVD